MPNILKNTTPWILVASSMVMLTVFVGYWNISTYLGEKKKLVEDVEIQLQLAFTEVKDSELIYFIRTHLSDDEGASHLLDSISIFFDTPPLFPASTIDIEGRFKSEYDSCRLSRDTAVILGIEIDSFPGTVMELQTGDLTVIASSNVNGVVRTETLEKVDYSDTMDYQLRHVNIRNHLEPRKRFNLFRDTPTVQTWINMEDSFPKRYESIYTTKTDSFFSPLTIFEADSLASNTSVDKTYALLKTKLEENRFPSRFSVINKPEQKAEGIKISYEAGGFGLTNWSIDLHDYQLYILRKMLPTLLFSLILLSVISLAFWTLLKNWTREKRLALVKNEFINNMTHELKTPISTVGVALEAISNFDLNRDEEKTREYLEMSRSEISRLSLLVDKVLNIAAFDSDKATISSQDVDLKKVIEDNIRAVRLQLEHLGGKVHFACLSPQPIIRGDELHLSNVVHNLIDNAIKYSSQNPEIIIKLEDNEDYFIITVKDNGIGIPYDYQDRIFDRFFRVPTNDRHDVKGHGLGLNYVQNVIHAHEGDITVSSIENEGTTFTITLPKNTYHA